VSTLAIHGGRPVRVAEFPARRTMGDAEASAVAEVMRSDKLSGFFGSPGPQWLGGPKVREFEGKWATAYGFEHAISFNSWTTGLMTAVGATGIGPGDEVIVSPYTMSASATAILFYGGIPIFADIDPDTFNLTADSIERCISPRTRAIMVVHLFGRAADMDPIMTLARRHGLKVIEDAAQAPGAYYRGHPLGAIGDIGGFSLNYHKHIHTGEGGMLVTNDAALALRAQLIRNHAENLVEAQQIDDLTNMVGSNYRMTELQAAIGVAQLDRLNACLEVRRALAARLTSRLAGLPGLRLPPPIDPISHAYYVYALRYDAAETGIPRGTFVRAVNAELPSPVTWEQSGWVEGYVRPLYLLPMYQKQIAIGSKGFPWTMNPSIRYAYAKGLCPIAERMHEHELILTPLVREPLRETDIDDLSDAIEKVLQHRSAIAA